MKNWMKLGLLFLVMLFVLSACGVSVEEEAEETRKKKNKTQTTQAITLDAETEESSAKTPAEESEKVPALTSSEETLPPETTGRPRESSISAEATKQAETTPEAKARRVLYAEPVSDLQNVAFPAYDIVEYTGTAADILRRSGKISKDDQIDSYSLTAPEDGMYRFEVNGLVSGFTVTMFLYDAGGYLLDSNYGCSNKEGLSVQLEKGKTYKITLESYSGTGSYELMIGQQKKAANLSGYTRICDKVEFIDQEINYLYNPDETGLYYFFVSKVKSGILLNMAVFDEDGYVADHVYGRSKNEGLDISLEAGKTYLFRISPYNGESLGDFTVDIGIQKPVKDISKYSEVTDTLQFEKQQIGYDFYTEEAGLYHFELNNVRSGFSVIVTVYDSDDYRLDYVVLSQEEGFSLELEGNSRYRIWVIQLYDTGSYTLKIGRQRKAVDISSYDDVQDAVRFTDQQIIYTYTPTETGTYQFGLAIGDSKTQVTVSVYDKNGYTENSCYAMEPSDTLGAYLTAGQTYTIVMEEAGYLGSYTLTIDLK